MHQDIYTDLKQQIRRKKRRTVFNRAVSILACTVMFCTTYALILPAITMEQETFCGVEEHSHSEACYGAAQQPVLVCTAERLDIHTHDDSCYGPEGNLVCGQCDYVAHSHDTGCYSPAGALVCTLPERSVHVHTDSCYVPGETQPEVLHVHSDSCYVLQRGDLTCTLEESEGHTHGDACFEPGNELLCTKQENHIHDSGCYELPLICTRSTEPHVHDGSCYGRGELTCSIPQNHVHGDSCRETTCICNNEAEDHTHDDSCYESRTICSLPENHSHGDSCYESIPVCGKAEGECHTHDTGCYGDEKLICTQEENHVHTGSCYQPELICTTAEDPGHTHGDDCYEQVTVIGCGLNEGEPEPTEPVEPVLVCTEPAAQVHVHGDGCFETVTTEAVPICGNTAADHIHEPACYELHCGLEEHIHATACYSNPDADLETREQWEASFAQVELTGDWNEDVLAIARTQLGYVESTNNYVVWEDGTTHGYTRYGDWYGSPHGDWCAMFVSFCLHYAEVEGMPLHWGVRPWIEELTDLKLYHEAEVYDPKPGDLIFYDWEGDDLSDHVGFVAEIIPATEDDPAQLKALEGNSSNCVQYVYYDLDDSRILGYSELPDNPEIYSCGLLRHSHNEYCYDDAGNFICQQIEHIHTDVCEPRDTLYCGLEIHTHGEGCFDEAGELVCQIPEHSHTDTCYVQAPAEEEEVEQTYFCGLEEHTHGETCYNEAGELVCEISEHTHSEECTVEPVTYYCGLEEHIHGETCYNEAGELVCEIPEHTHNEECTVEPVTYYCGLEEHTHGETCYNEAGELVCELTEHTHSEQCTTEPVTYYCFRQAHTHSDVCYDEAGNLLCQIPEHTHTDECTKIPVFLCGMQEHAHSEECYDDAGELICQLHVHTHSEQCIIPGGYICGLEEHTHNENCYDAEGSFICTLVEHTHTDACRAQNAYACGLTEHTHGESCYDAEGNLICEIPEHIHTAACVGRSLYYSDMQIRVHAVIRGVEDLPQKLTLKVRKVVPEQEPQSFGDMQVAVNEQISTQEQYLSQASFYEMYLLSEGQIYNLPETASVTVTMEFEEPIFTPDAMADATGTHAFMLTPEGGMQLPSDLPAEEEAPAETEAAAEETEPSVVESVISNIASSFQSILTPALALDDASQLEEIPAGEQPEGEIPDDSLVPEAPGTVYDVSGLTGEDYGNASQGITSVTFTTNRISTFAVALASTTQTGTFWTRVDSTDDITSDGTYMIVSAEGNYALGAESYRYSYETRYRTTATPVTVQTVKGNVSYYTISDSDSTEVRWKISANGIFRNEAISRYLDMSDSTLLDSSSTTHSLKYETPENCWWISSGSNYLRNTGTTSFIANSNKDRNAWTDQYNSRDMLIFKLSDKTSLDIPTDVRSPAEIEADGATETKPNYDPFLPVTGGLSGDTAVVNDQDETVSVSGQYFSDPSTSKLEARFHEDNVLNNYYNDGKVLTDKSVIYGKDDYGAFGTNYAPNTFSVTLSALGQAYKKPQSDIVATPVDVVFVLDTSSSMSSSSTSGATGKRAERMVEALNSSMAYIFSKHPANRVGVVTYSRGSSTLLNLGRYKANNNEFFYTGSLEINSGYQSGTITNAVYGHSSLTYEDGSAIGHTVGGANSIQGFGTYTQSGIARGYEVFKENDNITYTQVFDEGLETERKYTVYRQPIFILLSDGEPTYSTNIFMDVLNGPHYGDGNGEQGGGNSKGVHGYYTVLSANYYKRMTGIHYNMPALFYTVGMEISEPNDDGPLIRNSGTGDNYKRAVLNPNSTTLSLSSDIDDTGTISQLRNLLNNSLNVQSTTVCHTFWPEQELGIPHQNIPTLDNHPYTDNYSYANGAYFGTLEVNDLTAIFNNIVNNSQITSPYDFILYESSNVDLVDPIGEGMEIKGHPVLRFYGKNYTHKQITENEDKTVKTYHYEGIVTDPYMVPVRSYNLADIQVTVTTQTDGTQIVSMHVPDTALPIYMPSNAAAAYQDCNLTEHTHSETCVEDCQIPEHTHTSTCTVTSSMFYYEALPVRLIYQVGLTEESEQAVLDLKTKGGSLTFYTNAWEGAEHAQADLTPSLVNPFYYAINGESAKYHSHTIYKGGSESRPLPGSNYTGTMEYSVDCHWGATQMEGQIVGHVYHDLGNNGKLVFNVEKQLEDLPVKKVWDKSVTNTDSKEISVTLCKVTETTSETGTYPAEEVETVTLDSTKEWTHTFADLDAPNENFFYAIVETDSDGFLPTYSGGEIIEITVDNGSPVKAVKVDSAFFNTETEEDAEIPVITITNVPGVELPKTGGPGTILYTTGGLLLIAAAIFLLFYNRKSQISRP